MSIKNTLTDAKNQLTKILHTIGTIQTAIILTFFYYLVLAPFALLYKLSKISEKKDHHTDTFWIKRQIKKPTIETLQKQY